jgi:hypothetical protein
MRRCAQCFQKRTALEAQTAVFNFLRDPMTLAVDCLRKATAEMRAVAGRSTDERIMSSIDCIALDAVKPRVLRQCLINREFARKCTLRVSLEELWVKG